jgi:hypothetical protein
MQQKPAAGQRKKKPLGNHNITMDTSDSFSLHFDAEMCKKKVATPEKTMSKMKMKVILV